MDLSLGDFPDWKIAGPQAWGDPHPPTPSSVPPAASAMLVRGPNLVLRPVFTSVASEKISGIVRHHALRCLYCRRLLHCCAAALRGCSSLNYANFNKQHRCDPKAGSVLLQCRTLEADISPA